MPGCTTPRRLTGLVALLACLSQIGVGPVGRTAEPSKALDAGWQEAVISVRDAKPLLRFFEDVAGWRVIHSGVLPHETRAFYAGEPVSGDRHRLRPAREYLIADAERLPGFIRLIEFGDPRSIEIRAGSMPWDTGGMLSLMTRSNATSEVYSRAQALGWSAFSDPARLVLKDAGVVLTNVILRGPDSVTVSIYERLSPRMDDAPDLRRLRRPFNSMQVVRDINASRRFYTEVLGFEVVNSGDFINEQREPNNFGMPGNIVAANPIPFLIVGPRSSGPTQVEAVQLVGMEGRDLSERAVPPNYGLVALRFPVTSVALVAERLKQQAWPPAVAPTEIPLPPYGKVRILAVRSPDGAWLEFFETLRP